MLKKYLDTQYHATYGKGVLRFLSQGHTPVLSEWADPGGQLDFFAYDNGDMCNGPACAKCEWGYCWHCDNKGKHIPKCLDSET